MGSQTLEILRQGIWASFTGGWFYDPELDHFGNVFHLYLWLFLLCLPFALYMCFSQTVFAWLLYCITVGVVFVGLKVTNSRLHRMFDTGEKVEDNNSLDDGSARLENRDISLNPNQRDDPEQIELSVLNSGREEATPPVQCSSRNSFSEGPSKRGIPHVDSMELLTRFINSELSAQPCGSTIDLQVDVHHRDSSGSSGTDTGGGQGHSESRSHIEVTKINSLSSNFVMEVMQEVTEQNRRLGEDSEGKGPDEIRQNEQERVQDISNYAVDTVMTASSLSTLVQHPVSPTDASVYLPVASALSLPSSSEMALKGAGSVELGFMSQDPSVRAAELARGRNKSQQRQMGQSTDKQRVVRRARSELETCPEKPSQSVPPSHPVSLEIINRSNSSGMGIAGRIARPSVEMSRSALNEAIVELSDEQQPGAEDFVGSSRALSLRQHQSNRRPRQNSVPTQSGSGSLVRHWSLETSYKIEPIGGNAPQNNSSTWSNSSRHSISVSGDRTGEGVTKAASSSSSTSSTSSSDNYKVVEGKSLKTPRRKCGFILMNQKFVLEKDFETVQSSSSDASSLSSETLSISLPDSNDSYFTLVYRPSLQPTDKSENDATRLVLSYPQRVVPPEDQAESSWKKPLPSPAISETSTNGFEWLFCAADTPYPNEAKVLSLDKMEECKASCLEGMSDSSSSSPDETTPLEATQGPSSQSVRPKNRNESNNKVPDSNTLAETVLNKCLLDILNKNSTGDCEQEFKKLRRELAIKLPMNKRPKLLARRRRGPEGTPETLSLLPGTLTSDEGDGSSSASYVSPRRHLDLGPPAYLLASILSTPGTHLASNHDDTSPGAVHCFQDEAGKWLTYTFDENSSGIARGLNPVPSRQVEVADPKWESGSRRSSSSSSTVILDSPAAILHVPKFNSAATRQPFRARGPYRTCTTIRPLPSTSDLMEILTNGQPIQRSHQTRNSMMAAVTAAASMEGAPSVGSGASPGGSSQGGTETDLVSRIHFPVLTKKPREYYKFWLLPSVYLRIGFKRLALIALLDRNLTLMENSFSVGLAVLVAALGALTLSYNFFQDISSFVFCFVIAGCQYTLLKSVQPDAASPTHGYNRIVLYSRPVYFCLCCLLVISIETLLNCLAYFPSVTFYGILFNSREILRMIQQIVTFLLLFFPLIFSLGLLPQINTFLIYLLEQIDMHFFGGTATTGLLSAVYCLVRSTIAFVVLCGFAYGAVKEQHHQTKHILFSIYCGLLVSVCYLLSRSASDPTIIWILLKRHLWSEDKKEEDTNSDLIDPLPEKLQAIVEARLKSDIIFCIMIAVLVFAIQVSTVFIALQPYLEMTVHLCAIIWGVVLHYALPQMRKQLPWLCCAHPVLKANEYNDFEVHNPARLMWFEKCQVWLWFIEKNVIYPLVILSALATDSPKLIQSFGFLGGCILVVLCSMKCLRSAFNNPSHHFLILIFTLLFFKYDYSGPRETFLINFFVTSIAFDKCYEFLLKVRFVITYIAPWQITWGSAFHAFAQPFSVPHSAMLFVQTVISSVLSTPLSPFLGSAIFFTSYVRPVKFWEKDYNTKRVDHTNTRLASQLEQNPGADDNNLNSIFYEHLSRSLQHSLYGDLVLGRWGHVLEGDCFVLASDNLNCLVHITEIGNGLVTFQVRGLEFRGTYCQQREVEAISEGVEEDEGCCCCEPGHLPHMLSVNAAFNQRWLAWEVTATKYVLEGYSISDNSAISMLQVYDLRKALITYYIKSLVFYTLTSVSLEKWLGCDPIKEALKATLDKNFVDLDPIFNMNIDDDYDFCASGITRNSFCNVYLEWVQHCAMQKDKNLESSRDSQLVSLCFSLSLLARRALGTAAHNSFASVDFLLGGLHALFKGDFRITSPRDEWVFQDMDLLRKVVAPSVRMALKLHQDHFMSPDEYEDPASLYDAIVKYGSSMVISHEADPAWRNAVLSNVPSLLALRHVIEDGSDEYKIIMLNKRFLSFRVIKVNKECVRGLWAGQQQELVYLRNRNPERGSIQNAKQALRNIINSSCDQPIGYPIYVSPLTTSYCETSSTLCSIIGGPLSFTTFKKAIIRGWNRLRRRCGEGCSSGGTAVQQDVIDNACTIVESHRGSQSADGSSDNVGGRNIGGGGWVSANSSIGRGSTVSSLGRNSFTRTSSGTIAPPKLGPNAGPTALVTLNVLRTFENANNNNLSENNGRIADDLSNAIENTAV